MSGAAPQTLRVLYFAALRERMGTAAEELDAADFDDVRALAAWLVAHRPALRGVLGSVRFAVGDEFVTMERRLRAGDIVALIPPVSGG